MTNGLRLLIARPLCRQRLQRSPAIGGIRGSVSIVQALPGQGDLCRVSCLVVVQRPPAIGGIQGFVSVVQDRAGWQVFGIGVRRGMIPVRER